jgi:thiol-disulfide isomerase/thioredoxin
MAQSQDEQAILLGRTHYRVLQNSPQLVWFRQNYNAYQPNNSAIDALKGFPPDIRFIVFAGTWCSDTRDLLPPFYRVLDAAGINRNNVTLYFTDRDKHTPEGLENTYNVNRVPTFILLRNGSEIGRITETAQPSIEAELVNLLPR